MNVSSYGELAGRFIAVVEFASSLSGVDMGEEQLQELFTSFDIAEKYQSIWNKDMRAKNRVNNINLAEFKKLTEYQLLDAKIGYAEEKEGIRRNLEIAKLRAESGLQMEKFAEEIGVKSLSVQSWESHKRNCPAKNIENARRLKERK
jgi:DNA-binding transcriptional regulator YiaG